MYCPSCQDEYRADITTCAECNIPLISGAEVLAQQQGKSTPQRTMTIEPTDELISIMKGSVVDMKQVQALFKRHNIPSQALNVDGGGCNSGGCSGPTVAVQIRSTDLQEVRQILEAEYIRSTGLAEHDISTVGAVFDTEAEEATCPACGHTFPTAFSACPECGLNFAI